MKYSFFKNAIKLFFFIKLRFSVYVSFRHTQFTQHVRETLDENGGFEECATACKNSFSRSKCYKWQSQKQFVHQYLTCISILTGDSRATNAVRAACKEVGSVSDIIFEMRFSPSVFSSGTKRNYTPTHIHTQSNLLEHITTGFLCDVFRSVIA